MGRHTAIKTAFARMTLESQIRGLAAQIFALKAGENPPAGSWPAASAARRGVEEVLWDRLRTLDALIAGGPEPLSFTA